MWDKSYNILSPNDNKVSRQIGFSIKDAIEKAYPDQAIKETNARLGDFVTLENILKKSDGNTIQRGKIGNYVGNIVGMGVGGALGSAVNPGLGTAVGSAGGAAIGGAASKFLANPERITRGLKSEVGAIGKAGSKLGELISSKVKTPIPVKKTPIPSKKVTSTAPVKGQTSINSGNKKIIPIATGVVAGGTLIASKADAEQISKNFKREEFNQKNNPLPLKDVVVDDDLLNKLEKLRSLVGNKPIIINSGFRTPEYNKKVGGAEKSQHIEGKAADIEVKGMSSKELEKKAKEAGFAFTMTYDNKPHLHVDVRKSTPIKKRGE
jgi:hypothetical protein